MNCCCIIIGASCASEFADIRLTHISLSRLKTANIKIAQAIRSLSTKRRIILSGTPIQNDLGEFFSMMDFVNPGLFESYNAFKRVFEDPIVRSRQPDCSRAESSLGQERQAFWLFDFKLVDAVEY